MKTQSLIFLIFAGVCICSCNKDYLEKAPLGSLNETSLANIKGVEGLLIGAYSVLDGVISDYENPWYSAASNWIYGSICGSEAYTGSDPGDDPRTVILSMETFAHTSTNIALAMKWSILYDGIQRSNDVLRVMAQASDISQANQKRISAEARFLRAHYHFEAKKIWNKIPYIDESITYGRKNYYVSNEGNSWLRIEEDLLYALESLETTSYGGARGRANRYTAMALLAKAYVFQNKFAEARPLLETIVNSGVFELVLYQDNFDPGKRNGNEAVFSVQMSVNDGASGYNGNFGDILNFPYGGGPGTCCGFFCPSQYLVNHFKTNAADGLPDLNTFNESDVWNDEGYASTDTFTPYSGYLDPRLDWTVGRRGIPYLDWGLHPGKDWIRMQDLNGPYSPKKNTYYQYQQGILTDGSAWGGTSTNNVNLIRYADVILWVAEVEAEMGNLDQAREYVNQIRRRAADPEGWVKNADGNPAANYNVGEYNTTWPDLAFARKAIRYERMLELAMEGHRFFDLVRWGIADIEINDYLDNEKIKRTYLKDAHFEKGCDEYFAIPLTQIDLSAGADGIAQMHQNPCY